MGKILYLECNSGISGDMTVGALLDLGADRHVLEHALESLGVEGYHLHFGRKLVCGLDAFDFDVHLEEDGHEHSHGHEVACEDEHEHSHRHEVVGVDGHGHSHSYEVAGEDGHGHSHGHEVAGEDGHGHSHSHEVAGGDEHEHSHSHEMTCEDGNGDAPHFHHHDGGHVHRNLFDIYQIIDRLDSSGRVKDLARRMFRIVAEAEAKAHGLPVEEVHFHEVGAVDSIVDIVSVAVCVDNLGIDDVVVSVLAEGHGYVKCQHGILPVPVPATANIASANGLELRFTDNDGEMVTPTGAAIAAALRTRDSLPDACRILKIGMGAGNRIFKQANVLRAMLMEEGGEIKTARGLQTASEAQGGGVAQTTDESKGGGETQEAGAAQEDSMWMMETNLDDCTGEILGFTMELLLEAGAADVWYSPIFMKKNRPAYILSVLCRKDEREKMEEIILVHTTTIGIRRYPVARSVLAREMMSVDTDFGQADVKVCSYKDRVFFYPEYESVRRICRGSGMDFMSVYQEVRKKALVYQGARMKASLHQETCMEASLHQKACMKAGVHQEACMKAGMHQGACANAERKG